MKKTFILALLAVVCSLGANAQNRRDSRYYNNMTGKLDYHYNQHRGSTWRDGSNSGHSSRLGYYTDSYVGFRIGGALSQLNSDDKWYDSDDNKTGLTLGLVYGKNITHAVPLYIEAGLMYAAKGGEKEYIIRKLNYLEVPITLKYITYISRNTTIQPYGGGYFAYGVGGKSEFLDEHGTYSSFGKHGEFKRFDSGLRIGCGVSYDVLYGDLSLDIGLSDISRSESRANDVKTSSVQISVGVNF